ncbi:unnamed protein product, partial [Rotaria magnacalcarata]
QINFLNDVIVELRNTNEHLTKEIEFLKNPFVDDNELPESAVTTTKTSAPRLYLYCITQRDDSMSTGNKRYGCCQMATTDREDQNF